ncbi:MAG: hypothetical protein E7672_03395 [Ruminococcaceae bacterium]|nr:hypothetical protein [Oscillospiraceae bacterium]
MATEIERKFLIKLPSEDFFADKKARRRHIVQTYLTSDDAGERRVRRIEESGTISYVYTEKFPIENTKISRIENEREIDREEYERLLSDAYSELTKVRYTFPIESHVIEIDVYPHYIGGEALDGLAVMEIELTSEDEKFEIPDEIEVLRELTGTREFSNKVLAKKIKCDK